MMYRHRIRDLREFNQLTQQDIADLLSIARSTYSQYELGKRKIPTEHVIALSKFYRVSVDFLLGLTNQKKPYHRNK